MWAEVGGRLFDLLNALHLDLPADHDDERKQNDLARRTRTGIVRVGSQSVDDEPQAPFGG